MPTCSLHTGMNENQQVILAGIYICISSLRCHCISKISISGERAWHLFESKWTRKLFVRHTCSTTEETTFYGPNRSESIMDYVRGLTTYIKTI